jgi:hypothetical protein
MMLYPLQFRHKLGTIAKCLLSVVWERCFLRRWQTARPITTARRFHQCHSCKTLMLDWRALMTTFFAISRPPTRRLQRGTACRTCPRTQVHPVNEPALLILAVRAPSWPRVGPASVSVASVLSTTAPTALSKVDCAFRMVPNASAACTPDATRM